MVEVCMRLVSARSACAVTAWAVVLLARSLAEAQLPEPRLLVLEPPGGMRGSSVEVTLAGGDLVGISGMTFSHPGITAKPVPDHPDRLVVTIAPDVPAGLHEAAAITSHGVSNPRVFVVGRGPEFVKTEAIDTPDKAVAIPAGTTVNGRTAADQADHYAVECKPGERVRAEVWARRIDSLVTPVITVFGPDGREMRTIADDVAGDPAVDFTPVQAGRHVVRIHDKFVGGGAGYVYRLAVSTGPVVLGVFPPVVSVTGSTRGSAAGGHATFTVVGRDLGRGAVPLPGAARSGLQQLPVQVSPGEIQSAPPPVPAWRILSPWDTAADLAGLRGGLFDAAAAHPIVLAVDLPVIEEAEPNDDPAAPQAITRPCAVAGRFHPRGDRDWFTFDAKAGEEIVLDLSSRRLGATTDALLVVQQVMNTSGGKPEVKEVAHADDAPGAFTGESAIGRPGLDPLLTFKAAADGTYRVLVREQTVDAAADPTAAYVLQVRPARPDFRLLAFVARPTAKQTTLGLDSTMVAGGTSLTAGGTALIDVLVLRQDGFAGDVTIAAENLPAGVTAPPVTISGTAGRGLVVLQAADDAAPAVKGVRLVGRATIDGVDTARAATPVTLQRSYGPPESINVHHAPMRVSGMINVAVTSAVAPVTVRLKEPGKVWEASPGDRLSIPIEIVQRPGAKGVVSLVPLVHPNSPKTKLPPEIKVSELKIAELKPTDPQTAVPQTSADEVQIEVAATAAPGTYSVALGGSVKMAYAANADAAVRAKAEADKAAKEKANVTKDIDVPVVLPPITLVVSSKQQEPAKP